MPYPNEHAARITDPKQYNKFARKNIAPGVDIILGISKGGTHTQAYRFDAKKFTTAQARAWLKKNKVKPLSFTPASPVKLAEKAPAFVYVRKTIQEQFSDNNEWADILEAGKIFSMKKGEFDISREQIDEIAAHFNDGIMEITPFIDIEHARGESLGDIIALRACEVEELDENGKPEKVYKLQAKVSYNPYGERIVLTEKRYKYYSIDVDKYVNSKTGIETPNTMIALTVTNVPVFKNQRMIASEADPTGKQADGENKTLGENMDKFKAALEALVAAITEGAKADPEAVKAAITDEVIPAVQKAAGIEAESIAAQDATEVKQMSDKLDTLSKDVLKLTETNAAITLELADAKKEKAAKVLENKKLVFVDKFKAKIPPAQVDSFFAFYLSDEKAAESAIGLLPEIATGEAGSSADRKTGGEMKLSEIEQKFTDEVKTISLRDKVEFGKAFETAKTEKPELFKQMMDARNK